MPWFLTPHGPHFVVEPGTVDEYERRDYVQMTAQQVTDYYAGVAFPDPPSFATEAEVPGIVAGAVAAGTGPVADALRAASVAAVAEDIADRATVLGAAAAAASEGVAALGRLAPNPDKALVTQGLYTRSSLGSFRPLTVDPSVAGRVWGVSSAGLSFMDNNGTAARTDVGAMPSSQSAVQLTFTATYVFLLTSGNGSRLGQLWRSPLPATDGTGLTWTKMFDLTGGTTTVGGGVDGGENSYFRNACFATDGANGYLLEYGGVVTGGPSFYYTGNINAISYTWTKRTTWANGKHGHAVKVIGGVPWVMLGDGGYSDLGLWCATAANAGTWNRRSLYGEAAGGNTLYGVSFLPVTIDGHPLIVAESDTHHPHGVLAFNSQSIAKTGVLQSVNTIPAPYNGTVRSLTLTSEGNLMWVQTGENGAVGPYDSIWIAKAPFTTPVRLESIPATNALGTLGDPVESGNYVFFGINRIRKEKFVGQ